MPLRSTSSRKSGRSRVELELLTLLPHAAYSARLACESKELNRGERFILEAALPFKSGCIWLTDADWGTFGLAPVDVCSAAVDVELAFVLLLLLLLLQALVPPVASRDVTVLLGAVIVPLLLRKCLKENVDVDEEEPVAVAFVVFVALAVAVAGGAAAAAAVTAVSIIVAEPVVALIFV